MKCNWTLATLGFVSSALGRLTVFDSINTTPNGWTAGEILDSSEKLTLTVALKQQNVDSFEQRLLNISDPDHPDYGQFMEPNDVEQLLRPSNETSSKVNEWLANHGVQMGPVTNAFVTFQTNVSIANKLLGTKFQRFTNDRSNITHLRTLQYSVPEIVAPHIDFVQPTTRFGDSKSMRGTLKGRIKTTMASAALTAANSSSPNCDTIITPSCLLSLYNIRYGADSKNGNMLGFASFLDNYAQYVDLGLFEDNIAPYTKTKNISFFSINGSLNNQSEVDHSSTEANLDGQYTIAIAHPVPVIQFSTAGNGPLVPDIDQPTPADNNNEPYLDYLQGLLPFPNDMIPQVISHSYGEDEQSVPESYNRRVCSMFAQLGARGKSIIFSSGDAGVGDDCVSNDGQNKTKYMPQFPAACPFVTSVGATYRIPETAAGFSSGGFSDIYPTPKWQKRAVSSYISQLGQASSGLYNPKGRGFPDVSAQGVNFMTYDDGFKSLTSGTSASGPVFASVISLLNSARISEGKKPLGFLNPWLYKIAEHGVFNDITNGKSIGCNGASEQTGLPNGSPKIPNAGFNATQGWDPITGLGTPDFGKMLAVSSPGVSNEGGPLSVMDGETLI